MREALQTIRGLTSSPERRSVIAPVQQVPRLLRILHHLATELSYRRDTALQKREAEHQYLNEQAAEVFLRPAEGLLAVSQPLHALRQGSAPLVLLAQVDDQGHVVEVLVELTSEPE